MDEYRGNKFLRVASSPMMNASNIFRYSGTRLAVQENLAEHVYETMMIGYILIHEIMNISPESDLSISEYLEKALHHDMEECSTGDVSRPLKYHNKKVREELNLVAEEVALEIYKEYFDRTIYEEYWINAKSGSEGFILKIADMLTVAFKAVKEVGILNNLYFVRVVSEVVGYLGEVLKNLELEGHKYFTARAVEYLCDVVSDTRSVLTGLLNTHREVDKYGVIHNSIFKEDNHG